MTKALDGTYGLDITYIPPWLKDLAPGEYSLKELAKICKVSKPTICARFSALKVNVKYYKQGAVYNWKGIKEYVKI